ncbi:protein-tyrosine phosphatase-like protein [Schizophyllum amplum]|uniref:Protein-tyrosine phosphatase-like protein n=1 Tax=Schizophyllum amplum TaxID=97359 RepID=A0A550CCK6_9AGAR|nr:protein-tyrosine phosphatase-like protein [Auriculariopsis ampla]
MDSIRVTKVGGVACTRNGVTATGTVHLTAHHLILHFDEVGQQELWVPYPLISLVTKLPQTISGQSPLTFNQRTFETFSLAFDNERSATDVFDSVKELTVATTVTQLYAFYYTPNPPFPASDGWSIYSARAEFGRMGVGSRSKAWRFTDINKDYSFCPTYPSRMVVPTRISDATLQYASKYRSKCRIPVLTYLHWANYGSITRSSQPMVGITQNRSIQDEKLVEAAFHSHVAPDARATSSSIYGSTSTNMIVDARPTTNAVANTAKGAGTENMDHYKDARKAYLGIDHIHTMRDSLNKVVEALRDADTLLASINNDLQDSLPRLAVLDRQALRRSGWLRHISAILEGIVLITRNVHVNNSHVLVHCSDGWDRTSQLSSLAQLCLDPYYRTIKGFEVLVEKDWVSFGHKFLDRCGHLSSDKFFVSTPEPVNNASSAEAAQAFFASMQNRFASQSHLKETSPVFHQFLETVRQIQRQFPDRFEFNERFLHQLYYQLYSCQFGTFLFNTERERRVAHEEIGAPPCERTVSVWDYMNAPAEMEKNVNPTYDATLDDPKGRDMGVLFPNPKDVRFWHELYGRSDEEMNGRVVVEQAKGVEVVGPVETVEDDPVLRIATPSKIPLPPSPSRAPATLAPSTASPPPRARTPDPPSTTQRPVSTAESFRPFGNTGSNFSLKATGFAQGRQGMKASDLGGGMKSMWGRLSSNATAALSAVQEAYISTGKEGPAESPKEAELSGRTLSAWPDAAEGSSSSSGTTLPGTASWSPSTAAAMAPLTASGNPWATTKPVSPQIPSIFDNPWRTDAESAPRLLDAPITSRMSRSLSSPTPPKSLPAASSPWARESVADVELPGGPLSHSSTTPSATSPLQSPPRLILQRTRQSQVLQRSQRSHGIRISIRLVLV